MGAAASVSRELCRPLDGADVAGDPAAAKQEVIRLRQMLRAREVRAMAVFSGSAPVEATCVERVQAAVSAIKAEDAQWRACSEALSSMALSTARAADERLGAGALRRPLEGVPFVIKCNIDLAGTLSDASMPGLKDWRPETTATQVQRLLDAGAIPVAKTNMPEAALGCWGFSPLHGTTRNPVNPRYTTAGSSAGTAAAIAAGYVAIGLGSDTGGSLRMPAECCGVVGLRPSLARYPQSGVVPCNIRHDRAGPMADTVANLAVVDAVLAGEECSAASIQPADLSAGARFAVDMDMYAEASDGHQRAIDAAVRALEAAGARVSREGVQFRSIDFTPQAQNLDFREHGFDAYLASHGRDTTTDQVLEKSFYLPVIKPFFKQPTWFGQSLVNVKSLPQGETRDAAIATFEQEIAAAQARYEKFWDDNDVDFVLTPAIHGEPPKCLSEDEYQDFRKAFGTFGMAMGKSSGSMLYNELPSAPSLAMPTPVVHHSAEKVQEGEKDAGRPMPAGILLWSRPGGDKRLIAVGIALERAFAAERENQG